MLHKAKNLGEEKQLLRKVDASQRRDVDSCISVEKLNYRVRHNFEFIFWLWLAAWGCEQLASFPLLYKGYFDPVETDQDVVQQDGMGEKQL